jgi:hypothetical protein
VEARTHLRNRISLSNFGIPFTRSARSNDWRRLKLYVAGTSPSSEQALEIVPVAHRAAGVPGLRLEIIDALRKPATLRAAGLLTVPALCLESPGRLQWFPGSLDRPERVTRWLGEMCGAPA